MSVDSKAIGARLREVREDPPYWTRGELARMLRAQATPGELPLIAHIKSLTDMIKHWEAGKWIPRPRYRVLYCRLTGKTEAELFGPQADAQPTQRCPDELNARSTLMTNLRRWSWLAASPRATWERRLSPLWN